MSAKQSPEAHRRGGEIEERGGKKKKRENSLPDAFTIETGKTVAKIVFVQNLPSQRCVGEEENLSLYIT